MNVKKKSILIIFGTLLISVLMVSTASATSIPMRSGSRDFAREQINMDNSVEEGCLTTADLGILYEALGNIDNPEIANLLQNIINIIEENGHASANDIAGLDLPDFLSDYMGTNVNLVGIIRAGNTNGVFTAKVFPFPHWNFCSFIIFWQITLRNGGSLSVNGNSISGPKTVNMPLFIGFASCNPGRPFGTGDGNINGIMGIGFCITMTN